MEVAIKMPDDISTQTTVPVQLPCKVLEYLLRECDLKISDKLVHAYWDHLEEMGDEIAVQTKEFRSLANGCAWPLGLHGDEAAIGIINNPTNKVIGITLNIPLFRPRATRLSRWLLWSIESVRVWSVEETIYPVLQVIMESLNIATRDGVAGRRFIPTELRGDQAWFRYIFKHKAYWVRNDICFRCEASAKPAATNYTWNDCHGGWETTMRSTAEFIRDQLSAPHCF